MRQVREFVFLVISPHRESDGRICQKLSRVFDWFIVVLIVYSSAVAFASTFPLSFDGRIVLEYLQRYEGVVLWIFTVEYLLRLWTADLYFKADKPKRRFEYLRCMWKFIWTPLALVDLFAILPFWLPLPLLARYISNKHVFAALRFIRILRLLRYVKNYGRVLDNMYGVLREQRKELRVSSFAIGTLMMVSSVLMYAAEHEGQPEKFVDACSGLWWAVSTITTVGYGDLYPLTFWGRLFGAIITLAGVAALAVPTAIITSGFIKRNLTIKDVRKLLSEKDAEQDRKLEVQHELLGVLTKRFAEFEKLQQETVKEQNEKMERQRQMSDQLAASARDQRARLERLLLDADRERHEELNRQRQRIDRFESAANDRLSRLEKILLDENRAQNKRLEQSIRTMDGFASVANDRLSELKTALLETKNREREETLRLQTAVISQISQVVGERIARLEERMEVLQQAAERYFAPEVKPEGVLRKVASWFVPRRDKKSGCR